MMMMMIMMMMTMIMIMIVMMMTSFNNILSSSWETTLTIEPITFPGGLIPPFPSLNWTFKFDGTLGDLVGRCTLTVSKPELKACLVSVISA